MFAVIKFALSAAIIVLISEVAKRSIFWGGILASLPIVSILALIWLYLDTRDVQTVSSLSLNIFWMVLPSLVLFLVLPMLLKKQIPFPWALLLASMATVGAYYGMAQLLQRLGYKL